jgi:hypothetical protein
VENECRHGWLPHQRIERNCPCVRSKKARAIHEQFVVEAYPGLRELARRERRGPRLRPRQGHLL